MFAGLDVEMSLAGCLLFRRVPGKAPCLGDIIWWASRRQWCAGGGVSLLGSGSFLLWMRWWTLLFGTVCCHRGSNWVKEKQTSEVPVGNKWHLPEWVRIKPYPGTRNHLARNPVKCPNLGLLSMSWAHFASCHSPMGTFYALFIHKTQV